MSIKSILPLEKYTLISDLSIEEIIARLENNIDLENSPRYFGINTSSGKPYKGKLSENTFSITRVINYKNSFLPLIKGEMSAYLNGTRIKIIMRPVLFVLIFISIWMGVVGIVAVFFLFMILFPSPDSDVTPAVVLIPAGMFIFGALLTIISFKVESKKAKEFLVDVLQAQETAID